jgi:hypothetical protein
LASFQDNPGLSFSPVVSSHALFPLFFVRLVVARISASSKERAFILPIIDVDVLQTPPSRYLSERSGYSGVTAMLSTMRLGSVAFS